MFTLEICKGAHTLTQINSYKYTRVSSYEHNTAETAWCKLHWPKFIRVNHVILVRVNHLPKHALANDFNCTNWWGTKSARLKNMGQSKMHGRKTQHQTAGMVNARKGMYGKPNGVLHMSYVTEFHTDEQVLQCHSNKKLSYRRETMRVPFQLKLC